jgi:hypothetical protein
VTRKPKAPRGPKAIPELAKHHARAPLSLVDPRTAEIINARWGPNLIDNAEAKMDAILKAAGMPTEADILTRTAHGGGFRGLARLAEYRGYAIGSDVWYAAKIKDEIAATRAAMTRGRPDEILHEALHLGALMKEATIVVDNPGVFDLGLKQDAALERAIPAAAKLRRDDAAKDHQKWIDAARVIWENEPRLSRKKCAETIINDKHLSVTNQTVRKIISPYKPKVGNDN